MRTNNFIQAVDEIKANGGSRETMYITEVYRNRCMTIFGYADGTAEVFENTWAFASFDSVSEAVATINAIQEQYNKELKESNGRLEEMRAANPTPIRYESISDYYGVAGRYYGD